MTHNNPTPILFLIAAIIGITILYSFSPPSTLYQTANVNKYIEKYMKQPGCSFETEGQKQEPLVIALSGTDEENDEKSRSDILMIIKYYPETKKVLIISIPRDCRVEIPGKGVDKINAAHAHGNTKLQIKTLEHLFRTSIPYYVHVDFYGFIAIVDAIGGVKINAKKDFHGYWEGNDIYIKKGENILDGIHLLKYVRFRHDEDGDFGRIKRQQEVIISAAKHLIASGNISNIPDIIAIAREKVETNIGWIKIAGLVLSIRDFNSIQIETHTLKTASKTIGGIWYEIIDEENLEYLIKKLNS